LTILGLGDVLDRFTVVEKAELESTFKTEVKAGAELGRDVMPKVMAAELRGELQ
jgi:hypothetical protein